MKASSPAEVSVDLIAEIAELHARAARHDAEHAALRAEVAALVALVAGGQSGSEEDLSPRPPGIWVPRKEAWHAVGRTDQWVPSHSRRER